MIAAGNAELQYSSDARFQKRASERERARESERARERDGGGRERQKDARTDQLPVSEKVPQGCGSQALAAALF